MNSGPGPGSGSGNAGATDGRAREQSSSTLSGAADSFGLQASAGLGGVFAAGDRLGPVTIVQLLGAGGMGLVYEATQDRPARRVAVKLLRTGAAAPGLARRFAQEADLLARLQHPHIAQVHLAGMAATPAGDLPFLVMELIEAATPVTNYADGQQLAIRQRVALFATATAAVAHAHRSGVIHRDLKPGNILVSNAGSLRVIDFGVARLLAPDSADLTAATQAGELLGTVRYMSPEQLGLDHGPVDPRTDVYSLGLVLHELLFGELPYELRGRTILEATALLAQRTHSDPGPLARRLRGRVAAGDANPLAVILAKCLEPAARDRYADAGEFHADLDRWLAGEPIRARPPTLADSLIRLARRHRAAATAAALVAATILAAVTGISWFSLAAARQRQEALAARLLAEQALDTAERGRQEAAAQAREARRQLYFSTVLLAAEARDRDNLTAARRLLTEARQLAVGQAPETPELDCLAASLDESLAVWAGHDGTVHAVAWSPADHHAALGTADGQIWLWRPTADHGPSESTQSATATPFTPHDGPVWGVAFSPDGRLLATASADETVRIHGVESHDVIASIEGHAAAVYGVAFSPTGRLLASASRDGTVRLWDTTNWEEQGRLEGHAATVFSVCFSPTGDRILTTSRDGTARLWDAATRREQLAVSHGTSRVFSGTFSEDGQRFATAGEDATARIWQAADGRELAVLQHPLRVNSVAFLTDGDRLATASGDGLVRVWNITAGTVETSRRGHAAGIWSLAIDPVTQLAATGSVDGSGRLWSLAATGGPVVSLGGRGLALCNSSTGNGLAAGLADERVALLDAQTLAAPRQLESGAVGRVNDVTTTPDGQTLVAACDDGTVRRWTLPEGLPLPPLPLHRRRVYSVAFSPDGHTLATASEDRSVRLVEPETGNERLSLKHARRVFAAAFLNNGRRLATACEDRLVRIWNTDTGVELMSLAGHEGPVNWICCSPDGSRIASASSDGTVRVWPSDGGGPPLILTGPARQIWKVAFSPGGTRLAACSADGTVQMWDVASGRPVATLRGHADQVWGIAFASNGRGLFSTSWDGTLRAWGVSPAALFRLRQSGTPE
jgi:WD40 repeat protein